MADPSNSTAAAAASSSPAPAAAAATAATVKCTGEAILATSSSPNFLKDVPAHLRIQVIHQDDDIIVVYKPCNLRSVPGNAKNNHNTSDPSSFLPPGKKRKYGQDETAATGTTAPTTTKKMTPQEAWVEAIKVLAEDIGEENNQQQQQQQQQQPQESDEDLHKDKQLQDFLRRLGGRESQRASIPRRYAAFVRYIKRSRNRVFGEEDNSSASRSSTPVAVVQDQDLPEIAQQLFCRIEAKQQEILQQFRPQPTTDQESVVGQCKLLGLAKHSDSRANQDLFVVHRLDCQTSGLLVLARTATAASFLSQCWRTRDKVQKTYRALVERWPPWEENEKPEERQIEGEINLPMSPHPTERLKWVVNRESDGKESLTKWKVLQSINNNGDAGAGLGGVVLELKPITGRTHQLRVHCAAMGGVIRGDSLYGKAGEFLYLHAEKLAFPHPTTKEVVSFQIDPKW